MRMKLDKTLQKIKKMKPKLIISMANVNNAKLKRKPMTRLEWIPTIFSLLNNDVLIFFHGSIHS